MKFSTRIAIVLIFGGLTACHGTLYQLPSPPPPDQQRDVSLIPGEEQRKAEAQYLDARAAVVKLYNLLETKRYKEATKLLSVETQDFFASLGQGTTADVLASQKLHMPNGQVVAFNPVSTLVASDVSKLSDTIKGVEEHETPNRKELFATLPDGKVKRIVMIHEGGKWVLHRTRLDKPFSPPK